MRPLRTVIALLGEAARIAASMPVMSALLGLSSACVVAAAMFTLGESVVTERAILAEFSSDAARAVYIDDVSSTPGLPEPSIDRLERISQVEWVAAFSVPFDVTLPGLASGGRVPARIVVGNPPGIDMKPYDRTGAFVSTPAAEVLGLRSPAGSVRTKSGQTYGIVGSFAANGVLAEFGHGVLIRDQTNHNMPLRRLVLSVRDPNKVDHVAHLAIEALGVNRTDVEVRTSSSLVSAGEVVRGTVGEMNRRLVILTLGVGVALGSVVSFVSVSLRRRDFGRRRALGASRLQLVSVIVVASGIAVLAGAVLGSLTSTFAFHLIGRPVPPTDFTIATAYIAVVVLTASTAVPAIIAAFRDPVSALRVP